MRSPRGWETPKELPANVSEDFMEYIEEAPGLSLDDEFQFSCLHCGHLCCVDRSDILVSPSDILRLRRGAKMTTRQLHKEGFIRFFPGFHSLLPLCAVRMQSMPDSDKGACPFLMPVFVDAFSPTDVLEADVGDLLRYTFTYGDYPGCYPDGVSGFGCSLNENKPLVCRMFPLGRAWKGKEDSDDWPGEMKIIQSNYDCPGPKDGETWKVREWFEAMDVFSQFESSDLAWEMFDHANEIICRCIESEEFSDIEMQLVYVPLYGLLYDPDDTNDLLFQFVRMAKEDWATVNISFDASPEDDVKVLEATCQILSMMREAIEDTMRMLKSSISDYVKKRGIA